jgi:oligopeptide transport system substrate-binding protein
MRKIFLYTILSLSLLLASSCRDRMAGENVLRAAITEQLKGFDTAQAGDSISVAIQGQIYEPLFQYSYLKRPIQLEPLLAESMPEFSADGLTCTIRIKKNVFFQDDECFTQTKGKGRELTAADFIYSYKRLADMNNSSTGWWIFDGRIAGLNEFRTYTKSTKTPDYDRKVEGLKAIDRYSFQIKLIKPFPQILYVLAMPYSAAIPREACETYKDEFLNHPVGTGPYRLERWVRGSQIILVRNQNFRNELYPSEGMPEDRTNGLLADAGKKMPFIDKIIYQVIIEDQPLWLNFLKAKLDFSGIPKDNYDSAVSKDRQLTKQMLDKGIRLVITPAPVVSYIGFNMDDPLLGKNRLLRQAMSMAFDRTRYIELFSNKRALEANLPLPPDFEGFIPGYRNPAGYNLEKANKMLALAGFPEGKGLPVFNYDLGSTDTTTRQGADYFIQQMAAIGIRINVSSYTWPQFLERVKTRTSQIFGLAWEADYPDAENFLQLFYGPNSSPGANNVNYNNPEFDRLYEQASGMLSSPARTALYEKMARMVTEEVPWILLTSRIDFRLRYIWMKNYKPVNFTYNNIKYFRIDTALRDSIINGRKGGKK